MGKKLKPDIKFKKPKIEFFKAPAELAGPIIRLCSNKEASIDGCRGVIDYYDNLIKLSFPKGYVTFYGNGLYIKSFTDEEALICGEIFKVEYDFKGEKT